MGKILLFAATVAFSTFMGFRIGREHPKPFFAERTKEVMVRKCTIFVDVTMYHSYCLNPVDEKTGLPIEISSKEKDAIFHELAVGRFGTGQP